MEIIATICSKEKIGGETPLPAHKRYNSPRILLVSVRAKQAKQPLYFLSGKYGLIESTVKISYYDHLLKPEEIELLIPKVHAQIRQYNVTKIVFYTDKKPTSSPYIALIKKAAKAAKIDLEVNTI